MMKVRMRYTLRPFLALCAALACVATAFAQPPGGPPRSPRESALIDLTGQWVAVTGSPTSPT